MKADNRYVAYLDGFRGYAILLVMFSHFHFLQMDVAYLGVTLFFYVSGLLITKLLIAEFNKNSHINLKSFYVRRIFRLYPALLFMLLLTIVVIILHNYSIIWNDILSGLFYFTNYYLVYFSPDNSDVNYLLTSKILWSLSVEEHFYLFFPFLFVLFYTSKSRKLVYILTFLLGVFLLIRILVATSDKAGTEIFQVTYYTTHCRADSILFGCLSALLLYQNEHRVYLRLLKSYIAFFISIGILAFSLIYNDFFFQTTLKYTFQGLAFAIIIPAFANLFHKGFFYSIVANKVLVYIGKLSYSLYLFHWVALKIGNLHAEPATLKWYLIVVPFTILFSLLSYYCVEKPFLSLRKKFGSNALSSSVAL